jgi:hypothetical protein
VFLLSWNGILATIKIRWKLLIAALLLLILCIELVANRPALTILTNYIMFDPQSHWIGRLIWTYGLASVQNHPLFGIGMNEWERPGWMGDSIDNFWLLLPVKHGPAAALMLLTFVSIVLPISFKSGLDAKLTEYRTGLVITMTALFLVGCTVHFWDAAFVLFVFLMGSGSWMLEAGSSKEGASHSLRAQVNGCPDNGRVRRRRAEVQTI